MKRVLGQSQTFRLNYGDIEKLRAKFKDDPNVKNDQQLMRKVVERELAGLNTEIQPTLEQLVQPAIQLGLSQIFHDPLDYNFGDIISSESPLIIRPWFFLKFISIWRHADALLTRISKRLPTRIFVNTLSLQREPDRVFLEDPVKFALTSFLNDLCGDFPQLWIDRNQTFFRIVGLNRNDMQIPPHMVLSGQTAFVVPDKFFRHANIGLIFKGHSEIMTAFQGIAIQKLSHPAIDFTPVMYGAPPVNTSLKLLMEQWRNPAQGFYDPDDAEK